MRADCSNQANVRAEGSHQQALQHTADRLHRPQIRRIERSWWDDVRTPTSCGVWWINSTGRDSIATAALNRGLGERESLLAFVRNELPADRRLDRVDRVKPPFAGHALQLARTAVAERDARAHNEILDGARHEHLVGARERTDASADVDGHPGDVVTH